jgi:hypothetical protein
MCTSTGRAETQRVDRVSGRKPSECGWGGRGALTASRSKISTNGFAMALRSRPEPLRLPPHLEHRRPACGVNAASSESKAGRLQSTHFIENTRPVIRGSAFGAIRVRTMDGIERHAVYSNGGKGVINIRQIALALEGVYVKNREEFVVVGWTDPEGARPWLGALLLALLRPGWKAGLCRPRRHRHRLCGA